MAMIFLNISRNFVKIAVKNYVCMWIPRCRSQTLTKLGNLGSSVMVISVHTKKRTNLHNIQLKGKNSESISWFTDEFAWYSYGPEKNLQRYGSEVSPLYNLSAITTKISFHYSYNDYASHPTVSSNNVTVIKKFDQDVRFAITWSRFEHWFLNRN